MDTIAQTFLSDIERHLTAQNIEPSAFGKQALGDPNFIFDLRKGRSPSARTMDKVRAFMAVQATPATPATSAAIKTIATPERLSHLERLEAEAIHIIREVAAECEKPVMLYSIGKDSAVMLHLAMKAFYPAKPPFPLMHVDTRWKFQDMYALRDSTVKKLEPRLDKPVAAELKKARGELRSLTDYAPNWVLTCVALALGVGTMVGWRRIVVTVGEKIGKDHLTYAQGASAELVAMSTIGISAGLGLPVSTTHVLSSGVAGTMVAQRSGLQMQTITKIASAWLLTLPVSMLLAGVLFLVLRVALT